MGATELTDKAVQIVELLEAEAPALRDLPYISIHSVSRRPGDIEAAHKGVFRLRDAHFALSPPVDWWEEPAPDQENEGSSKTPSSSPTLFWPTLASLRCSCDWP